MNQPVPPVHEPHTGVRRKTRTPSIPDAPTRPGVPKPNLDPAPAQPPAKPAGGWSTQKPLDTVIADVVKDAGGALSLENVKALITRECRDLEELLHEKNAGYGNSALNPMRVFSKASPIEQLYVRIDDKLSRISRGDLTKVPEEKLRDTVRDLQGYLVLLQVAYRLNLR